MLAQKTILLSRIQDFLPDPKNLVFRAYYSICFGFSLYQLCYIVLISSASSKSLHVFFFQDLDFSKDSRSLVLSGVLFHLFWFQSLSLVLNSTRLTALAQKFYFDSKIWISLQIQEIMFIKHIIT